MLRKWAYWLPVSYFLIAAPMAYYRHFVDPWAGGENQLFPWLELIVLGPPYILFSLFLWLVILFLIGLVVDRLGRVPDFPYPGRDGEADGGSTDR
jgi:hypothetical protein